jgi:FtsP/CotA-like multicopper oxidase with cupredoxin domain
MPFNCDLNDFPCDPQAAERSQFEFQAGKTYRLRLINAGGAGTQKFSIDNHELIVIANDFIPVVPYSTDVVTLGVGQRSDVLVKATGQPTDAVWMRSELDVPCLNVTSYQANATAVVFYSEADRETLPQTTAAEWQSNNCANVLRHKSYSL